MKTNAVMDNIKTFEVTHHLDRVTVVFADGNPQHEHTSTVQVEMTREAFTAFMRELEQGRPVTDAG